MLRPAALLDANILYSAGIRDFLLRLADRYLYAPMWSTEIHTEWMRSILDARPDLTRDMLERTRAVMDRHFPDALVAKSADAAIGLDLPDPGDRHVLAAAIHGGADVIVTMNLRDFPAEVLAPYALAAEHRDAFIRGLFEDRPDEVLATAREHRAALQHPPRSASKHLAALESLGLIQTVSALRHYEDLL